MRPRDVWTPDDRSPRQLRHARVKVAGSLLVLAVLLAALAAILV